MLDNDLYINISGMNFYYQMKPFRIGALMTLQKEPENPYDSEAIMASLPVLGKVGYVANSVQTVVAGCMSAGRIYDKIPDECAAVVRFITSSKVIARVLPDKKLTVKISVDFEDINKQENYDFIFDTKENMLEDV